MGIQTETEGEGISVTVRFSKRDGAPVRFIPADGIDEAAAIREVDLQAKYHWSPTELAGKLKLSTAKAKALRWRLGIDDDPGCLHEFVFGSQRLPRFSDNAYAKMRDALPEVDINEVWRRYRTHGQGPTA